MRIKLRKYGTKRRFGGRTQFNINLDPDLLGRLGIKTGLEGLNNKLNNGGNNIGSDNNNNGR